MLRQELIQDSTYSNTARIEHIDAEIMAVNATGFIPVDLFNRLVSPIPEEYKVQMSEPMFGENIKDAIRITKDWLSSRD